jgi:hypothetical protein
MNITEPAAAFARRLMLHMYNGLCPDSIEGWETRDPECPACTALDELALLRNKAEQDIPLRFVQHLVSEVLASGDCEIATAGGSGRCIEDAVAVRWEHGFADQVCEHHAQTSIARGALVVFAKRHDGKD